MELLGYGNLILCPRKGHSFYAKSLMQDDNSKIDTRKRIRVTNGEISEVLFLIQQVRCSPPTRHAS